MNSTAVYIVSGSADKYILNLVRGFKRKGARLLGHNIIVVPNLRLKDALAHLGPYQTLTKVRYIDPGG
jgi:hypothetical protein